MTRPIFWVCWDYGQGGLWARVRADSAEQVRARLPQLEVFESAPTALDEESLEMIRSSAVQDLDAAPSGWLKEFLPPPQQLIASATEFRAFLEQVQRLLSNGALKQCSPGRPGLPQVEILHLPLSGPWPDVVEADFVDARDHPYHLFVDCYHGSGVWHDPKAIVVDRSSGASPRNSGIEELQDWKFEVSEVSAGVYRATGTDRVGHRVVIEGAEPDECLEECRSAAVKLVRAR